MSLEIVSTGAVLGAEICCIDLSQPPGVNAFAEIEHAYNKHGVIFPQSADHARAAGCVHPLA